jgi:hypothetical protein
MPADKTIESRKRVADAGVVLLLSPSQNHRNAASPLARGDLPSRRRQEEEEEDSGNLATRTFRGFWNTLRASVPRLQKVACTARRNPPSDAHCAGNATLRR